MVKKYDGNIWMDVGDLSFLSSLISIGYPKLSIVNNVPYIAYGDGWNGNKITVMKYKGNDWIHVGTPGFSKENGFLEGSRIPSLYVYQDIVYVAYNKVFPSKEITTMKYVDNDNCSTKYECNASWQLVGTQGFSEGDADSFDLFIHDNIPYIAYKYSNNSDKVILKKYNGSIWVEVGSPGFSAEKVDDINLVISNNVPYVAYLENRSYTGSGGKVIVKKYNGTNWIGIGNSDLLEWKASYIDLSILNDTPYIAYDDVNNDDKAAVKKYDGNNWVNVGDLGFSEVWTNVSLSIFNGTPYIAYDNKGYIMVKRYDDTAWIDISGSGFPAEAGWSGISLAIFNDYPYIAYSDKAAVKKYDGTAWIDVGNPGFSAGRIYNVNLTMLDDVPYIAYIDEAYYEKAIVMKYEEGSWTHVGAPGLLQDLFFYNGLSLAMSKDTAYVAYGNKVVKYILDSDKDGIADNEDNCLNYYNVSQRDRDGDGKGDVCDNCVKIPNPEQTDENGNGRGDVCESNAVELLDFEQRGNTLIWATASETDNAGYHVWIGIPIAGQCGGKGSQYTRVNRLTNELIPAKGSSKEGASYSYEVSPLTNDATFCYGIEDVNTKGLSTFHIIPARANQ